MFNKSFITSVFLLILAIVVVFGVSSRGVPVVVENNLENIPLEILGFKAKEDFFSESVYRELNADKHVYRHYRSPDDKQVDLYIGYYGTAKGGRTAHNPYSCLPGAGWGIIESKKTVLRPEKYSNAVSINFILSQKGETYETMLHWYQSAGNKVLASGIQQNIQRFIGRIFSTKNDGAYVQVSVISGNEKLNESELLVKSFAKKILEMLPEYWPIEE